MESITLIGFAAGFLTTIAFLPQVIKTWKLKETRDISLVMFIMFCSGVLLWLIYGILKDDRPIIIANFVSFILAMIILVFKVRYK